MVNRPNGILSDRNFQVGTEENEGKTLLFRETLKQLKVFLLPGVEIRDAFKRCNGGPNYTKCYSSYPDAFFSMVPNRPGDDGKSLAAKREQIRDSNRQRCLCWFFEGNENGQVHRSLEKGEPVRLCEIYLHGEEDILPILPGRGKTGERGVIYPPAVLEKRSQSVRVLSVLREIETGKFVVLVRTESHNGVYNFE